MSQKQNRRDFIKTAGVLTAAAMILNPNDLFARTPVEQRRKGGSKKMQLDWENFTGQMKYTFTISGCSRTSTPIVITRITWDGYKGYGEAAMPPYLGETQESCNQFLLKARPVLDKFDNPFVLDDILPAIDKVTTNNCAAKASVDIALHDLIGNIFGQPWWKIWGFNPEKTPYTSYTIGYDADDDILNKKIEDAAWAKIIKVKLGIGDAQDKRMIKMIRSKLNTPICIDANQGWKDKYYALDMINWLSERNVVMIEQPMPKAWLDETAWVTERSPLPIIADEACQRLTDIPHLKGVYSGINIKLMKCTGMREAREMISLAQDFRMKLMVGCMTETSVAISAAAQIAPKVTWADLDGNILIANDCFDGMKLVNGKVTLFDKPGLGLTKKPDIINL
ncbi:MAG: twin-arginine translocation signal domain-containing protein [Bacteroidales bacterium]|jgi:L-alanine-DL-glutamate epimerase-like enolase superfamily enzyme|nr:twin-arginine translocation signal domain-containing protein [Bacteroidales bacterium]MCI2122183.1 twin-arginine translocation signal domain-containing protein [Bacteroidales bacterium]MCI2145597.1 twin-arginine translocation signal domain-containing protein [Bacteroidales bacterium]